eukprot:CAMPEP_0194228158 /NCGR_PEP_ID=MMETSP0156-20130528/43232_1 /TAXON_ID=33649 /ORGANISM="Thalassionema nitzschioides, Strain L26-B" /LENGTH=308 /DNA_ID=CAMNT_0038960665 /DNA_START=628 /DNA_END=1551 /DNA_ORIENTATION=+
MEQRPGMYDVICNCRTQKSFDHIGNRRFRVIIENHSFSYDNAKSRIDKSVIVMSIFRTINDAGGNLIRKPRKDNSDQAEWTTLSVAQSKEKIGHALRDAIIAQEKDSSSRRNIYSVIGGGRSTKFQLQNRKTRRLSLISSTAGNYFRIKDNSEWMTLSVAQSKEKIGHALRDAIISQEKDSSSRRDIYSVIGGGRSTKFQLQNRKTRRLSLISSTTGSYFRIKDLANATRPLPTKRWLPGAPEPVRSSPLSEYYSSSSDGIVDDDSSSVITGSTASLMEETSLFEPLEVLSYDQHSEDVTSLISSWIE